MSLPKLLRRCAGACLILASLASPASPSDLRIGSPAPSITLRTLDGHSVPLEALRGKTVIVTFWATWCGPCRDELPLLSSYAQEHAKDGLVILAFSLDTPETLPQVRQVASTLPFPTGLLDDPLVPGYGRIWRLPVSFVVDREGRLTHNGWQDKQPALTREQLEHLVTPLLTDTAH